MRTLLALPVLPLLAVVVEVRAMDAADPSAALVRGNTAFALDLYTRLAQEDGNRFLSPLSISTALAMTYAGAEGETALPMSSSSRPTHSGSSPARESSRTFRSGSR
jgi:serine protease inhibitor